MSGTPRSSSATSGSSKRAAVGSTREFNAARLKLRAALARASAPNLRRIERLLRLSEDTVGDEAEPAIEEAVRAIRKAHQAKERVRRRRHPVERFKVWR